MTPQKAIYKWYILPLGGLYATDPTFYGNQETTKNRIGDVVFVLKKIWSSIGFQGVFSSWMPPKHPGPPKLSFR